MTCTMAQSLFYSRHHVNSEVPYEDAPTLQLLIFVNGAFAPFRFLPSRLVFVAFGFVTFV
jgi:hypothetical protein